MYKEITLLLDKLGFGDFLRPVIRCLREQSLMLARLRFLWRRPRQIDAYFQNHEIRMLHLGASDRILVGWLNSDLEPAGKSHVFLDATKRFPFGDGSLDFVFSEHFIEHIDRSEGERCMREIYRCLKPGGVMRVATPNLIRYVQLFRANLEPRETEYLRQFQEKFHLNSISPCISLNHLVYNWGHRFLYDEAELIRLIQSAGFTTISQAPVGKSDYAQLVKIEQHAKFYGNEMNEFETMVLEATK
jgi:predicted SAM-dependent methyltransferase